MLNDLGITASSGTQGDALFSELFSDFHVLDYSSPSHYISKMWARYESYCKKESIANSNMNGKVFEYLLASLCIREQLYPLFLNAKVAFVPNVNFDLMFYTPSIGPICWSAKTSLRERYKQADLETIALKYVHRKAKGYLLTLSKDEAPGVKKKIETGDVIGLDDVILADTSEFDELVDSMKIYQLTHPGKIDIITSSQVVTEAKVRDYFSS